MSTKTCAIILNWNGWPDTLDCLESVLNGTRTPELIIVVDNNSTDHSCVTIQAWADKNFSFKELTDQNDTHTWQNLTGSTFLLLRNTNNQGYAGGNNLAIRHVLALEIFTYIWVLNNDTVVYEGALEALQSYASTHGEEGIIGSTILCDDDRETLECAGGARYSATTTITKNLLAGYTVDEAIHYSYPLRLDYIAGCAMFFQVEVLKKCNLFNESFFLFYEELDLCSCAKSRGYSLGWCRESIVFHKGRKSIGSLAELDKNKLCLANYHETLSTLLFSKTWFPALLPWILLFRFFGKLFCLITRKEMFLIRPLLDDYKDFFRGKNQRENYGKQTNKSQPPDIE